MPSHRLPGRSMVGAVQHVHRVQGRTSLVATSAAPQQLLVFVPTPVFRSAAQGLGKILLYELTRECTVQLEWSRRGGLHRCTSDTVPVAWVDAKTWGHLIKFGFKQKLKVKGKRTQQQ
jgi:hypothetical protein